MHFILCGIYSQLVFLHLSFNELNSTPTLLRITFLQIINYILKFYFSQTGRISLQEILFERSFSSSPKYLKAKIQHGGPFLSQ